MHRHEELFLAICCRGFHWQAACAAYAAKDGAILLIRAEHSPPTTETANHLRFRHETYLLREESRCSAYTAILPLSPSFQRRVPDAKIHTMNPIKSWDLIYLNKLGSDLDNDWVYYRVRSDGGNFRDPITICRVEWHTFKDIDLIWDEKKAVITSPGLTGLASAYEETCRLMKYRWGVDHDDSIIIGSLIVE